MRILAAGSEVTPTLPTSCGSLPPEGAVFSLGRPGGKLDPHACHFVCCAAPRGGWPCLGRPGAAADVSHAGPSWGCQGGSRPRHCGFTLLELLVVIAIIAVATAGVTLSLRDSSQTALEREAQRLAVLFESARAQSRASGTAVIWRPTADGFRFEGLASGALPTRWLEAGTRAGANVAIQLGPEPIIGAQAVDIVSGGQDQTQPARVLRIATDGLRPFVLQTAAQP
jgi:general secretion pathway protein H